MTAGRRPNKPRKREAGDAILPARVADLKQAPPIALSPADSRIFAEALANPQPVSDRLEDTIRRYREQGDASRSRGPKKRYSSARSHEQRD
jgi:hypothetical protein